MIGVDGCGSRSQGKKIQVSCETSVTNVSTSGRPAGFAYTVARCAFGNISFSALAVSPVSTRSSTINQPSRDGWLIVDDLVDTGETAKALKLMLPKAHLATVYAKPAGRPLVDTFVTEVSQDTWIFFPWDLEPQPSTPIIGQR